MFRFLTSALNLTTKMTDALKKIPFHPLLFALFPVLSLLANNAFEVRIADASRALLLLAMAGGLLLGISVLLRERRHMAAMASTAAITLFFSYGHFYEWGRHLTGWTLGVVRHRYLLPATLCLVIALVLFLRARPGWAENLTPGLNAASLVLVLIPLTGVVRSEIEFIRATSPSQDSGSAACEVEGYRFGDESSTEGAARDPDIYYIILDAYARHDVLESTYNFDNRPFLEALEERGFYVAYGSQSNYANTGLSLASSLNMDYHNFPEDIAKSENPTQHWPSLSRSKVRRLLECRGYYVAAFDSGYYWSGWRDADLFLNPTSGRKETTALAGLNAFEAQLVNTTILRVAVDAAIALPSFLSPDIQNPADEHRQRILYAFDTLEGSVSALPSPKFVFAHIVSPHTPFVFGPDGEWRDVEGPFTLVEREATSVLESEAYPAQVQYINKRILSAVDALLASYPSERQPVILIQADHGTGSGEVDRMRILNAYYLPDGGDRHLHNTISPVNSFRVVFNHYFGANFELLPDVSCYSTYDHLYDFRVITNPLNEEANGEDLAGVCR